MMMPGSEPSRSGKRSVPSNEPMNQWPIPAKHRQGPGVSDVRSDDAANCHGHPVSDRAHGLGRGRNEKIGVDGGHRIMPNARIKRRVIREPPPTPVMPTRTPT